MSLSSYIKQDLLARICSGKEHLPELTLKKLSDRYRVSMTPVRMALEELVSEGYLEKSNRRLVINRERAQSAPPGVQNAEPPKDYYQIIFEDLTRTSLQGKAIYLREQSTAEQYGISRWDVQRIFTRLAGEGLMEHIPRCGWRLRAFRKKDFDAFLRIRSLLELEALEIAWPYLVEADLRAIRHLNRLPASESEPPGMDNSLHDYILNKADNFYIADFIQRHGTYYKLLFDYEALDRETAIQTVHQHHAILDAMIARDLPAAKAALSDHINNNHPVIKRMLETDTLAQMIQQDLDISRADPARNGQTKGDG